MESLKLIFNKSAFYSCSILFLCIVFSQISNAQNIDWHTNANPSLNTINDVVFSPDGKYVLSGTNCHPASIRIYEVDKGKLIWDYTLGDDFMCVMGVSFSSNSAYLAAIEEFGNVLLFSNSDYKPIILDTIETGTSFAFATAISPKNNAVAVACSDGMLKLYSISDGDEMLSIAAHPMWVTTLAFTTDGEYIITGGNDRKVKVWNLDGTLAFTCIGHQNDITDVKVSMDNKYIYSSSKDGNIIVLDLKNGTKLNTISAHSNGVNAIDVSSDGSKIIAALPDSTCLIFDLKTNQILAKMQYENTGEMTAVAWSPNGDKIVTGSQKSKLIMWDLQKVLSIDKNVNHLDISVYPNPANNNFIIDNLPDKFEYKIFIYNEIGYKCLEFKTKSTSINIPLNNMKNGIYNVLIINNKFSKTTKLSIANK